MPGDERRAGTWDERAALAEAAVLGRFVRGVPGIAWGRSSWPAVAFRPFRRGGTPGWHYWWSAHLVDAAVDAWEHRPSPARRRTARALARGIRIRNGGTLARPFYDDLAWLGLAFAADRGERLPGSLPSDPLGRNRDAERIAARLEAAVDSGISALPWRVGSRLFNAPANGPAAILFARTGRLDAAVALTDWLHETLEDPDRGLIIDGVIAEPDGDRPVPQLYTYCQGVTLGADAELARREAGERFARRAAALIEAIAAWTGPGLVLPDSGGGDGGLFAGITCRYLARAARVLAEPKAAAAEAEAERLSRAAESARSLVLSNARALWEGRVELDGLPQFSVDARRPADPSPLAPERDLSVQLGAWLTLEAAVDVPAGHPASPDPRSR